MIKINSRKMKFKKSKLIINQLKILLLKKMILLINKINNKNKFQKKIKLMNLL